jgi:hypothetical protein
MQLQGILVFDSCPLVTLVIGVIDAALRRIHHKCQYCWSARVTVYYITILGSARLNLATPSLLTITHTLQSMLRPSCPSLSIPPIPI